MNTNNKANEQENSKKKKNFPWLRVNKSPNREKKKEKEKDKKDETIRLGVNPNIQIPIASPSTVPSPAPTPVAKQQSDLADEARLMKQKYQNVPRKLTAEEEEKEVFENVDQARPVISNHLLRPGKMRWKENKEEEEKIDKKKEIKEDTEREKNSLTKKSSTPSTDRPEKISARRKNSKKANDEVVDAALLVKIDKLEKENEELKKRLDEVQKILKKRKEKEESKELCEEVSKVAIRTLVLMKKNHILDTMLDMKSNKLLYTFFRECEKPSEQIASLVDEAVAKGLRYMIVCNHQIEDIIDGEMRDFICNSNLAKKAILRAMFANPALIPDMWGGGPLLEKIRREKMQEQGEVPEDDKEKREKDKKFNI